MTHFFSGLRGLLVALMAGIVISGCSRDNPEALLASTRDAMSKRDFKAAVIQAKSLLQNQPDSAEGRFLLGRALFESGDVSSARVEFSRALELRYSADEVVPMLLQTHIDLNEPKKVLDDGQKAGVLSPAARAKVLTSIAFAHVALGNSAAAAKAIDDAIAADPESDTARIGQARLMVAKRDFAGATAVVDAVLIKAPSNQEAHALRGDLLMLRNMAEMAIPSYQKAVALRPDSVRLRSALVQSMLASAKFDPKSPKFADALKEIGELKKLAPSHPLTLAWIAHTAVAKNDLQAAREATQQLLKVAPDWPPGQYLAGLTEFRLNSFVQAEALLTSVAKAVPDSLNARRLLARIYLANGQPGKAVAILEQSLAATQTDAEILAIAGEAYIQLGRIDKAELLLAKAVKISPDDVGNRVSLALTRLGKGGNEAALVELEQVSASDKGVTADMALIANLMVRGQSERALKAIEVLRKKLPDNPLAYDLRGRVLYESRDFAGARSGFEKALELKPSYFPAAANLATLDLYEGKRDAAGKRYEAVIAAEPRHTTALVSLAEFKAKGNAPMEEVVALLNKAIASSALDIGPRFALVNYYLSVNEPKKAVAAAQEAQAAIIGAPTPQFLDLLGRAQAAAGEFNQALSTFGKLIALLPNAAEVHLRIAEVHVANKNTEAAIQSLRKAVELKPDLVLANSMLAAISLGKGNPDEALAIARKLQKVRPGDAEGYLLEGNIAATRKSWGEAEAAFRAGLKNAPTSPLAIKLHAAMTSGGKKADADRFAATWIKDYPRDVDFRLYVAEHAMLRNDLLVAAGHYQEALKARPEDPNLLNNLALVEFGLKRPDAIEIAEKANRLAPNRPAFMDTLGILLADKGEFGKAIELLEKAARISPGDLAIRLNYARVLVKAGKKADAKKELDELAKLGDKFPAQQEVLKLAREL